MRTTPFHATLVLALCGASTFAQSTFRVNVDDRGVQTAEEGILAYRARSISDDGRYVAFHSAAANLVPGDTNGARDVFVHDRWTGATERVSVNSLGVEANATSSFPSVSADGRYVAFESNASNLTPGVPLGMLAVYVRDRAVGTTVIASVSSSGAQPSGASSAPYLSGDGRWVVFQSGAKLTGNAPQGGSFVYARDLVTATTFLVSASSAGVGATLAGRPWISANGRYATFGSPGANLVPGDTNNVNDAFLWDTQTQTTVRVSLGSGGAEATQPTYDAVVSDDGRLVAFSNASALVAGVVPNALNTYLHDRQTLQTTLLSRDENGLPVGGATNPIWISQDGRYVALQSTEALLASDTNGAYDVYLHDTLSGSSRRMSLDSVGQEIAAWSYGGSFTPDARFHTFSSVGEGLVPGDTNGEFDVFVRDLGVATQQVAYCVAKTNSLGCVPSIGSSGTPSVARPDSFFATATGVRSAKTGMFLWGLGSAVQPFGGGTLCVAPPRIRTPLSSSGGSAGGGDCTGAYSFHFDPSAMGVGAGVAVFGQYLTRDPGATLGLGLTDALRFDVIP